MHWTITALLIALTAPVFMTFINLYFYYRFRERFLGLWSLSWLTGTIRGILMIWAIKTGKNDFFTLLDYVGSIVSGLPLILGVFSFLETKAHPILTIGSLLALFWVAISDVFQLGLFASSIPVFGFLSMIHVWAGYRILKSGDLYTAKYLAGWAFVLWGIHKLSYPVFKTFPQFLPIGFFISMILFLVLSASLIFLYVEKINDALKESEKKYRSLVCNIPDSVWTANAKGDILYSSIGAYKTCHDPDVVNVIPEVSHKFHGIHPEDLEYFTSSWHQFFSNSQPLDVEYRLKGPDGSWIWMHDKAFSTYSLNGSRCADGISSEITFRKKSEKEKEALITQLNEKISQVNTLSGLLPICAACKKIRDDKGYWNQIEGYIQDHSDATFSHSVCPECVKKLYPDI